MHYKTFTSAYDIEDFGVNDDIETCNELYMFSDNDEIYVEFEDDLFNSYDNEGLEKDLEDSGNLFSYKLTKDIEVENDSDGDIENDLMGACLIAKAFSIPKRKNL